MLPSKDICWSLIIGMVQLAYMVLPVQAQECSKPIGKPNMVLTEASITKETFGEGTNANFECEIGYVSAGGSRSVTCTAGVWSEVKLTCKRRSCGHPGEVTNGKYILEGVEFGARAAVTCDTGYTLVGSGVRNCLAEGWDGRVPVCEVVKCGKPPTIVNGGPVIPPEDEYSYRSVVEYSCEKEFTLVGTKSIVCEKDGEFQPAPPECKMVSCPAPVVENGVRIEGRSPPYKHKSFVTYKCNDGYEMTGEASLTCEIEGWSASIPTCKVVSCPDPVVENGVRIEGRSPPYKHKSFVTYKCNDGYEMTGEASLTCEIEGWSASIPTCKVVSCPDPVVENGVRIQGRSPPYKHKSYVMYKCNDGFKMTGEASLTCEIEGWSASIPTCKALPTTTGENVLPKNILNGYYSDLQSFGWPIIVNYMTVTALLTPQLTSLA
ncbi:C4b-binding protein-like isoform X4 [Salvelinus alpinus]|uniref:C4b-binding protein-like isoform X4 n=1 Tax=Salvelinus alpinus TaxID=8036 RepID=UPI0039FC9D69